MKNSMIFLLILTSAISCFSSGIEDKEKVRLNTAIDLLYRENFEEALDIFTEISSDYPDHPIGPFFMGFYYNFLASFYETDRFDSQIVIYYDKAEKNAAFHLGFSGSDPWFNFYKGASLINRAYLLSRDGSRFSAIGKTFDGIEYIKRSLQSGTELGDAQLLLGTYKFYKSSFLSWLWDSRDEALKIIKNSSETSYFSKYLALSTLGWAYIDMGNYVKAEETAGLALKKYPGSHLFMFLKARSLYEQNKPEQAAELYGKILGILEKREEKYSNIDIFNAHYFLSMCFSEMNDESKSVQHRNKAAALNLTDKEKRLLGKRIKELKRSEYR